VTDVEREAPPASDEPPTESLAADGERPFPISEAYGFATQAVHAGARPDPATGARNVPIYQTTSYVFDDVDHAAALFNLQTFGYIYSRLTNPTVAALEERVAALEGGRAAVAAASGHAAQLLTFYTLLEPGDDIVAARQLYGGSLTQFRHTFRRLGWGASFVDATDPDAFRRAIGPRTKALFVESLANPGGLVVDLEALAAIAHEASIPLVVDNTLATPYLCRPFEWGADLVIHSLTKFLSGHGTSMGGIVVESGRFDWRGSGRFPFLAGPDPAYHDLDFIETFGDFGFSMKARAVALRDLGPALSPTNAFFILTGIETLPLRMERHVANARAIAEFLAGHPAVAWVSYAGLPSSPSHRLAGRYLPRGAGSVFTIGLRGGFEAGVRTVEAVNLWSHLANVGDTRSLILHPASTTHRQLSDDERIAAGAGPDVVRLSVGIESVEDLIADLDQALSAAGRGEAVDLRQSSVQH
jgi:OAH/OAS sulfhydrylase